MAVTTRQDKVRKVLARHEAKLADLKSGKKNAKYVKTYGERWESYLNWDIERTIEDIESNKRKLIEAERLDAKETAKLAKESARKSFIDSLPECLKVWMEDHRKAVIKWETEKKEEYEKLYHSKSFNELRLMHREDWRKYNEMIRYCCDVTEESIRKLAAESAKAYIVDLIARVEKHIGKIKSLDEVRVDGLAINGYITGEKGKVELRTIIAGGYNIQCLHNRVMVIKM